MSSFEEQFPELKGQHLLSLSMYLEGINRTAFKKDYGVEEFEGIRFAYAETDIEKFCLSKSKVKEALKKYGCDILPLLKELGLEDEE